MKILIKNKKWETSFERAKLICEVTGRNKIFNIKFTVLTAFDCAVL